MELELIKPIISGLGGGLLSLWLMMKWSRHVPKGFQSKSSGQLVAEYRSSIVAANVIFLGTVAFGIYLFKSGKFPTNSWQHFALVAGAAVVAPALVFLLPVVLKGRNKIGEAISALAIAEHTPIPVLGAIFLVGVVSLASALGGLATSSRFQ